MCSFVERQPRKVPTDGFGVDLTKWPIVVAAAAVDDLSIALKVEDAAAAPARVNFANQFVVVSRNSSGVVAIPFGFPIDDSRVQKEATDLRLG